VKCWVCSLSEENWRIAQDKGVVGVSTLFSDRMLKVEPNDPLVIFVFKSKPSHQQKVSEVLVPGIYRANSKPFESREDIGFKPVTYEKLPNIPLTLDYRVKIEPYRLKELDLLQVSKNWKIQEKERDKIKIPGAPGMMEELPEDFFQSILSQFPMTEQLQSPGPQIQKCPSCGSSISASATFCPSCGARAN